jgi:hypothetical protein
MAQKSASPPSRVKSAFLALIGSSSPEALRKEVEHGPFYYTDALTTSALTGASGVQVRARAAILQRWQEMQADPIVGGALRMHVTSALAGSETNGDAVFIEAKADFKGKGEMEKLVKEAAEDLTKMFNAVAMTVAYNGAAYGDAYARIYTKPGKGVTDLGVDELMMPPLVQPYEVGNKTVAVRVALGPRSAETLTMDQVARLKMPRTSYVPQPMAVEKALRIRVTEDDASQQIPMPSLAGGSFLYDAEGQWLNFRSALSSLTAQRLLDSLDESIFTLQVDGMTKEQQQVMSKNLEQVFKKSKELADKALKDGRSFMGRIRYLLPVFREKQILQMQGLNSSGGTGQGRAANTTVEDVLFHAKLLSGALGIDLSMLGFADLLSGGLGDGGFFRTSVQAAERTKSIRVALTEFYSHIVAVHLWKKKGVFFEPGTEPWQINFYGNISSMEAERQRTATENANTGLLLTQVFTQLKDSGLDEEGMQHFLERVLKLEEKDAKLYASALAKAKKTEQEQGGGFGGGDPGGGPFGGPPGVGEEEEPPQRVPKLEAAE